VKQEHVDRYANWLADSVISLAKRNPKAWIIDLRMNTGGNITPMMSGLASFFGNGILSYYLDKDGQAVSTARVQDGAFSLDDNRAAIKNPLPALQKAKVAVIIGPGTASSGEGLAVHFKQRKNSRLFGQQTAGVANATTGFVFNNDNSYFLLTTAVIGNARKRALPEFVAPQVSVVLNDSFTDLYNDRAVKASLAWLKR
jgi:C-terminal processing protease CtpA/Prc